MEEIFWSLTFIFFYFLFFFFFFTEFYKSSKKDPRVFQRLWNVKINSELSATYAAIIILASIVFCLTAFTSAAQDYQFMLVASVPVSGILSLIIYLFM